MRLRRAARCYHHAVIACYGKDLTSGRRNGSHQYVVMPSFSTIKVLLATTFWRAVTAGELGEARPYAFQPWQAVGGGGAGRRTGAARHRAAPADDGLGGGRGGPRQRDLRPRPRDPARAARRRRPADRRHRPREQIGRASWWG